MQYWKIKFKSKAAKKFSKLTPNVREKMLHYLKNRVACDHDPRRFGKPLQRELYGLWRFRVQGYRIIVNIEDDEFLVLVIDVDKRDKVYRRNS